MAPVVSFLSLAALCRATPWHRLDTYTFDDYIREYQKVYSSESEADSRRATFETRLRSIRQHNADPTFTWKRGVNKFSDWTDEERLSRTMGLNKALLHSQVEASRSNANVRTRSVRPKLDQWDWRSVSPPVLTPVKNQGECGSCWSFATAETLESHWALHTGELQELSEQFILDCTPNPSKCGGTGGCNGGTANLAYSRLKELGGIPSEWTYPYTSGTGEAGACHGLPLSPEHAHSGQVMAAANVTGFVEVTSNDLDAVMEAVSHEGPLSVTVDASTWHDYETGVYNGGNHTNPELNHLVQLVGYGTDSKTGLDYFIVRNSWTPLWGENGFIRLARTADCGVDLNPSDGDGCSGGPSTVKVCGQSGILYHAVFPTVTGKSSSTIVV